MEKERNSELGQELAEALGKLFDLQRATRYFGPSPLDLMGPLMKVYLACTHRCSQEARRVIEESMSLSCSTNTKSRMELWSIMDKHIDGVNHVIPDHLFDSSSEETLGVIKEQIAAITALPWNEGIK